LTLFEQVSAAYPTFAIYPSKWRKSRLGVIVFAGFVPQTVISQIKPVHAGSYDANAAANAASADAQYDRDHRLWTSCTHALVVALNAGGISTAAYIANNVLIGWLRSNNLLNVVYTATNTMPNGVQTGDLVFMNLGASSGDYWDHSVVITSGGLASESIPDSDFNDSVGNFDRHFFDRQFYNGNWVGFDHFMVVRPVGTQSPPGTPTITTPTNGQTLSTLTFNVTIQPGSDNYTGQHDFNLIVSDNPQFSNPVFDNSGGWSQSTSIQITVPHNGQFWLELRQGDTVGMSSAWVTETFFAEIPNGQQLLQNGGFEQDDAYWAFNPNHDLNCNHATTYSGAYEGSKFMAVNRDGHPTDCYSLYQDTKFYPVPGDVYTAAVYVRMGSAGIPRHGAISLWALGGTQEQSYQNYTLSTTWECFSTTLSVANGNHSGLRVELYMNDTDKGPDYNFDAVTLERGTQNACPAIAVGQNAGTWNNQTSAFWTDQFNQAYTLMNRPAAMATDASTGSQFTVNGDAMIVNPGTDRVFWVGWGTASLMKANNYPFDRVVGQNESWGTLGLVGPPTTDEVFMGGTAWQTCFTNGCLSASNGTATYVPWPTVDLTQWRVDGFNEIDSATLGGYSIVHNRIMDDNGFFLNGGSGTSPDPFLLPTNFQMHFWKQINFTAGTYQFQASTLVPGEWVTIMADYNLDGNWTTLLDATGHSAGATVYSTVTVPAGVHRIFIYYGHTTGNGYGMTVYWQPLAIDTIGIFRPSSNNGTFFLRLHNSQGFADLSVQFNPAAKAYPVVGDWLGTGVDTVGVYDQTNGLFSLCTKNDTTACGNNANILNFVLGIAGDQPLAGHWHAHAIHDGVGVFRPSNGLIYLKNELATGYADYTMVLGVPGDIGVAGDWDGNGISSPGVFRPNSVTFYLSNQVVNGSVIGDYAVTLGYPGDVPFVGDWIAQGHAGVGVFRPSNGLIYLKNALTTGYADVQIVYGIPNDRPIAGHWGIGSAPAPHNPVIVPNTALPTAATATPTPHVKGTPQSSFDG